MKIVYVFATACFFKAMVLMARKKGEISLFKNEKDGWSFEQRRLLHGSNINVAAGVYALSNAMLIHLEKQDRVSLPTTLNKKI